MNEIDLAILVVASPKGIPLKALGQHKSLARKLSEHEIFTISNGKISATPLQLTNLITNLLYYFNTSNNNTSKLKGGHPSIHSKKQAKISERQKQLGDILNGVSPGSSGGRNIIKDVIPDPELRQMARDFERAYNDKFRKTLKPMSTARSKVCFARAALFCERACITPEQYLDIAEKFSGNWRKRIGVKVVQPWMLPYLEEDVANEVGGGLDKKEMNAKEVQALLAKNGFGERKLEECQDILSMAKLGGRVTVETRLRKEVEWLRNRLQK